MTLGSCATDRVRREGSRSALRAAWRAFAVEAPAPGDTASASRFDAAERAAVSALDGARAALPASRRPEDRYLAATLDQLAERLRTRHAARLAVLHATSAPAAVARRGPVHYDQTNDLREAEADADGVAESTLLQLAAWERRVLHERFLSDSYVALVQAEAADARAHAASDGPPPQRAEIEADLARWDALVAAEARSAR